MNRRLQQFLAAENISQSQFADTIGVARASISHILAGRNKPGFDFIERTARAYPDLNLDWLITGRGKMYNGAKSAPEAPAGPIPPLPSASQGSLFDSPETAAAPQPGAPLPAQSASSIHLDRPKQSIINQHSISKIIVFYTDGSFLELA